MPDDLPVDVLTELGRVTWAAIKLEDYTESLCAFIQPANPRTDKRQVSQKIKDAKRVLKGWPNSRVREDAMTWLERASYAIEQRNAALHATPVVQLGCPTANEQRLLLGEMPRESPIHRAATDCRGAECTTIRAGRRGLRMARYRNRSGHRVPASSESWPCGRCDCGRLKGCAKAAAVAARSCHLRSSWCRCRWQTGRDASFPH